MSSTEDLRAYLGRLLGWANTGAIDHALRSIELARVHRAQLVLCGAGDLVPLAHRLHRRAFGDDAPFIVCDPRRGNTPASVRSPANVVDAAAAFNAAVGGSLCIRRRRPPHEFSSLVARLRGSDDVQYICLEEDSLRCLVRPGPIEVPHIAERAEDLARIVDEYIFDAIVALAAPPRSLALTERDRQWLIEDAATTSISEATFALADTRHNSPPAGHALTSRRCFQCPARCSSSLSCPCGGRRSVVAVVVDSALARGVLDALGLPCTPATFAPARDPPQAELWFGDAW